MKLRSTITFFAASLLSYQAAAVDCSSSSRTETTPTERFTMNVDGTVTDNRTGLEWMRCSVGQKWDGTTCIGEAKPFKWIQTDSAKNAVNDTAYAGHADWRVPMVPELASIVELRCFNPRVNVAVFPETPSELFWSSMEKMGASEYAYTLDFGGGDAAPTAKTEDGVVRLVRGGPWWTPPSMTQ